MGQGMRELSLSDTASLHRASTLPGSIKENGKATSGTGRRAASSSESSSANGGEKHDHEFGFPEEERAEMEECLNQVRGHLGEFVLEPLAWSDWVGVLLNGADAIYSAP